MPGKLSYDRGEVICSSILALVGKGSIDRADLIKRSARPAYITNRFIDQMLADGSLVLTDDNKIKGAS